MVPSDVAFSAVMMEFPQSFTQRQSLPPDATTRPPAGSLDQGDICRQCRSMTPVRVQESKIYWAMLLMRITHSKSPVCQKKIATAKLHRC